MICIYHNKDLDGFCSGAIMRLKWPDATFIGADYGDKLDIPANEDVMMADFSLPMSDMLELGRMSTSFVWVDHHKSAIDEFYRCEAGDRDYVITPVLDASISACEGVWRHLFGWQPFPSAVLLLGEYDTWRGFGSDAWNDITLPFQYGMRLRCNSLDTFPERVLFADPLSKLIADTITTGQVCLDYQRQQDKFRCRRAFVADLIGYKAICLNMPDVSSLTFESVYDPAIHDLMVGFTVGTSHCGYSLRSDKIDCSGIARAFGGGGHKGAAGFGIDGTDPMVVFKIEKK